MNKRNENINVPSIFVVLGATGDLMAKKIVPALFNLHLKKSLPRDFRLIGVSRRDWKDEDMKRHVEAILSVKASDSPHESVESFLKLVTYHKLSFDAHDHYLALKDELKKIDDERGMCSNKLFYLSVPPRFYDMILENLDRSGLTEECAPGEGWTRLVVEKPFGSNEKSAKALDARVAKFFKEDQIYRIDHYLAKEMLQNIIAFRFGNNLFEKEWDGDFIEKINIRLFEKIGAEDRGAFYDNVGALEDVGQNHLLQMLALVTMESPKDASPDAIREARAELLKTLKIPSIQEAGKMSFRAQYEGYRSIKGVASDSSVETYFRIKGFIENSRWMGVPFILEGGKRLGEPLKEIEITLRHPNPCLCPPGNHIKNRIMIHLEPREGITAVFYAKKTGLTQELEERVFTFRLREGERVKSQYTEEYERLLIDCVKGDQTLFVSSPEITAMWKFIDPFIASWEKGLTPLRYYVPDSPAISVEAAVIDEAGRGLTLPQKEIGVFGLGKMGANVARQLHGKGWHVVAGNRSPEAINQIAKEKIEGAFTHKEFLAKLNAPRIVWVMITAGKGVDEFLFGTDGIVRHLKRGDIVIDGGNSFFEDTVRRGKLLKKKGIRFMDVGFSGGPAGALNGGSLMIGGDKKTFEYLEPLFKDLSVPGGYAYFGDAGAGHFVKMVHNGIEYGMMQSIAEGFALMKKSPFKLNLEKIANVYNRGSVIESRLIGWLEEAFQTYGEDLKPISGSVAYTGEGEWTVKSGKKMKLKLPVIEDSFKFRVRSKKSPSYMGKILSALRNRFGGHSIQGK